MDDQSFIHLIICQALKVPEGEPIYLYIYVDRERGERERKREKARLKERVELSTVGVSSSLDSRKSSRLTAETPTVSTVGVSSRLDRINSA
jgi:hypothetical protein